MLERATEPSVVSAVSVYLACEEPMKQIFAGERTWARPSVGASRIILKVVENSPHFSQEARQWAREEYYKPSNYGRAREQVRTFWTEDAQHFETKNYQSVRPPGAQAGQPPTRQPVVSPSNSVPALPAAARPPAKRASVGPGTNATTPAQVTSTARALAVAPASSATPAPLWPWLLLAVSSLGGWLWWRSR